MNKLIVIILVFFYSCEEKKADHEQLKSDYLTKNNEFSDQVKAEGLSKDIITNQINYLQTIQLDTISTDAKKSIAVKVEKLNQSTIQDQVVLTGRLEAYQEIDVQSSVSGKVSEFKANGEFVKAGDFIYKADAGLYYQKYISAKGNMVQTEKSYEKWKSDIKTYERLLKSNDISRDEYQNYEIQFLKAEQTMNSAKVIVEEARLAYENAAFRAPFNGYVGNINLTIGQQINPGQQIARLADFSKFKVIAHLSIDEVQRFKKGNKAEFTAESIQLNGQIESISPIADKRTGTYLTRIAFQNNKKNQIVSGLFGMVTLFGKEYQKQYVVNQSDILDDNGQKYLFIIKSGRTMRFEIDEQLRIGKRSIINGQFAENDVYVTSGAGRLADNLQVNIIE